MTKNGISPVIIRGIHGKVSVSQQRYVNRLGVSSNFFEERGEFIDSKDSKQLRSFFCHYANRLSYAEVCNLLTHQIGSPVCTAQHIAHQVLEEASRMSACIAKEIHGVQLCLPFFNTTIDIYAPLLETAPDNEVKLYDDAVGVKMQKEKRSDDDYEKPQKTVQTDVIVLQHPQTDTYSYLVAGKSSDNTPNYDIETYLSAMFSILMCGACYDLIAITDGATAIRKRLHRVFGNQLTIILDWYHLDKKIWALAGLFCRNKTEKEQHAKNIIKYLWKGQVAEAIIYLNETVVSKNEDKKRELLTYLNKHTAEIIDYERRQKAGRCIGSGRGEKANDQIVAMRQKKKGTAWSRDGSRSLAIIKTLQLNNQWDSYWSKVA